ncbi:DUF4168 domain-containing protein [Candidatus Nitrosacidococcus tergens]|uniref:DUF4168 domain-containing protein n=1 Tax=Candidatus Nitrosacidococcus tergens TaxID=553981 RepID=A0A7G1Q9Q1_9GAMM|nr:DUF4168 domain-containing protein [Candidatus Nitrosacidococcus tergens]CAB1275903.1 conserved exported protein of unknown function [Candidatus Nitrosacidococcus tergens]
MTHQFYKIITALTTALGIVLFTSVVFAQESQQGQTPSSAMQEEQNVSSPSDSELRHFANAATDIQKIQQNALPQIQQAKSEDDRIKLQQDAQQKMISAVQSHKLTINRYQQIASAMQTDQALQKKLMQLMQKK